MSDPSSTVTGSSGTTLLVAPFPQWRKGFRPRIPVVDPRLLVTPQHAADLGHDGLVVPGLPAPTKA
jgi:hypothetical protein